MRPVGPVCCSVTEAPGIEDPDGSVTRPVAVALKLCASKFAIHPNRIIAVRKRITHSLLHSRKNEFGFLAVIGGEAVHLVFDIGPLRVHCAGEMVSLRNFKSIAANFS